MRTERPIDTIKAKRTHRRGIRRHAGTADAAKRVSKELSLLKSIICHDILNQLTALYAILSLSEMQDTTPEMKEYIRKEQKIAETMQGQLRFMRDFQEAEMKAPVWQVLGAVIRQVTDQVSLPNIAMDCRVGRIEIYADPLLECVFYNLLANSLMHGERVSAIAIHARETAGDLAIVYEDNGCGIGSLEKEKIFLKGYGKNTGLGLYLIREILTINGMTIEETGEPGMGARFVIHVPGGLYRVGGEPEG
ncbi:MAG: HAMP domain-containing sensor histidine kinase [Methanoregula sp.]